VADLRRWLRSPRTQGILLALAYTLLALHRLGEVAIVGDDEAREVGIVQDMVAGHWLWPRFNQELLPDKPTLYHWLAAMPVAVAGCSEVAVRLPSILAAAGLVWWTVEFGAWLLGPAAGLTAGVVLATMRSVFAHARVARPDALLVLLLCLALGHAYRWWREGDRRRATAALAFIGLATLAKGPVAPALFAVTFGLFLLWQRQLHRLWQFITPEGVAAFVVLGLGWYALAWAGWGEEFVHQHLMGRYVRNLVGGLATGHAYSPKPWYFHFFFYPQHLPGLVWPWTPFIAVALWQIWREGGLRDPRARFLLCWTVAPILVFTPAEWKLRYYLLPSAPPLALLTAPLLMRLIRAPLTPLRMTRASIATAAAVLLAVTAGVLVYLEHPSVLSKSDQLTRDAIITALGGVGATASVIGIVAGMATVAIACRAWAGLVVIVGAASIVWLIAGEPAMDVAASRSDSLAAFGRAAATRFPQGTPLSFYGPTVRSVVVYVGRPVPSLERRPDRIGPGDGVIALAPAYQALAKDARVGPPLASGAGLVGNVEHATLVLAEGKAPGGAPQTNSSAAPEPASRR